MLRILRHSLKLLGDIFQSVQYNGFLAAIIAAAGLVLPFFSKAEMANIPGAQLDTALHIIEYISLVFVFIFLIVILVQFFGAFCIWLSQQVPESIDILPAHTHDIESVFDENLRKEIEFNYASLRIINREYEELTECYAVLRAIYVRDSEMGFVDLTSWFFERISNKRLRWKNNNNCEIKIGPRTGLETLRVYRLGIDFDDHSCAVQDFNICDKKYKSMKNGNTEFFVVIEIYGKLSNKDIKPKKFYGHIKIEFEKTNDGASYGLDIWKVDRRLEKSLRAKLTAT
ncbi:MAG: hypothetical protein HS100_22740 [Anaerolineales bacterium]|nr:hypothetical protein [Anaerolineales bacterium]